MKERETGQRRSMDRLVERGTGCVQIASSFGVAKSPASESATILPKIGGMVERGWSVCALIQTKSMEIPLCKSACVFRTIDCAISDLHWRKCLSAACESPKILEGTWCDGII